MKRLIYEVIMTAILLFVVRTIVGVEIEEFWNETAQPYLEQHAWLWVAAMISSFWGGVASTLIMFLAVHYGFSAVLRWRRKRAYSSNLPEELNPHIHSEDAPATAPDRASYYDLLSFTTRYVLPACDALIDLQKDLIGASVPNKAARDFAVDGLLSGSKSEVRDFWRNYNTLEQHINQSEPTLTFDEMIRCIRALELRGYRRFRLQAASLAWQLADKKEIGGDVIKTAKEWVSRHNRLVEKYEEVRNDPRFSGQNTDGGSLFWPRKQNGFGPTVASRGDPLVQLKAVDTNSRKTLA